MVGRKHVYWLGGSGVRLSLQQDERVRACVALGVLFTLVFLYLISVPNFPFLIVPYISLLFFTYAWLVPASFFLSSYPHRYAAVFSPRPSYPSYTRSLVA